MKTGHAKRILHAAAGVVAGWVLWTSSASAALNMANVPLFLPGAVPPLNMLVMGRDHKLYYEAYNDHSDLNGDGVLDITYKPDEIDYFGYFDSHKCYAYDSGNNRFDPMRVTANKKCTVDDSEFSGDWLNYITMSRLDALRKVLYGGYRSTDTASLTVLERAHIPQDAHSWGKSYESISENGYDITEYTPYPIPDSNSSHLFANTTPLGASSPRLRVIINAQNSALTPLKIWNWVSIERPVAGDGSDNVVVGTDGSGGESRGTRTVKDEYRVRVKVCDSSVGLESNCRLYSNGTSYKPIGLLQDFGETEQMMFGLLTGSYAENTDGGVLRRRVGSIENEIDPDDGTFDPSVLGIIRTLDRLRTTGFGGYYEYRCGWKVSGPISEGECQMWGNPIAEMMYEALRYYAGKNGATPAFAVSFGEGEEDELPGGGLPVATWNNPYGAGGMPVCAKPFMTVISDINPSYDSDDLPGSAFSSFSGDLSGLNVSALGDTIWAREMGGSQKVFIGNSGGVTDNAPTPKDATSFGNIRGLAPEEPTKEGSYYAASVAYHGFTTDLNPATGRQAVQTFAVALASPLPRIEIPVNGHTITLIPFAKTVGGSVNGTTVSPKTNSFQPTNQIVDFYVESLTPTSGLFRVNFEDVEQGADHDMDAIVSYAYEVNGDGTVDIALTSEYAAGSLIQHIGYVISGTTTDGIFFEVRDKDTAAANDPDYFLDTPPTFTGKPPAPDSGAGTWNDDTELPLTATRRFTPGTDDSAILLKDPLWYAAKWGGFEDSNGNDEPDDPSEWDTDNDGDPDNYFLVTNALTLGQELREAFQEILSRTSSASAVATNSTRLDTNTLVYQAQFRSDDWTGKLLAYQLTSTGALGALAWDTTQPGKIPSHDVRQIFTRDPATGSGIPFVWSSLTPSQQAALNQAPDGTTDAFGDERVLWLRGDQSQERQNGGLFRNRSGVLGDIINSDPQFAGAQNFGYEALPTGTPGKTTYQAFRESKVNATTGAVLKPMLYVAANDGMLHAFDAATGVERFAYIPSTLIPELNQLMNPSYTHRYFLDGQSFIGDAYINRGGVDRWATVLVGAMGAGGKTVFALDVTDPHAFGAGNVMWEFTHAELGHVIGQPAVARMADGTWVAVFGNGYNSTSGRAMLFIVRLSDGALLKVIDTGVGGDNGLGPPSLLADATRTIQSIYAGDLKGNLWKFDVSSGTVANWDVAYRPGGVNTPLFVATDGATPQPITAPPEIGRHPQGGYMIYFGTGKYFETGDNVVSTSPPAQVQTFYGVWDKVTANPADNTPITGGRASLQQQSIIFEGQPANSNFEVRVTSDTDVDWSVKRGWYLDLLPPSGVPQGERVVSLPVLRNGRVIFPTLIPSSDPCEFGGTSWLMEIEAVSGARLDEPPIDINEDGSINVGDIVDIDPNDADDGPDENEDDERMAPSGVRSRQGIIDTPAIITLPDGEELKVASGTEGNLESVRETGAFDRSRGSWRQLR